MKTWIKNPLLTWSAGGVNAPSGIVVDDGTITELVTGSEPLDPCDTIVDATDCILMPGLINCHHHFYQTLTRSYPPALNKELFDWLTNLYPVWAGLTESSIATSTKTAICELLLSGCTTTTDHHYVFSERTGNAIDIQAEVAGQLGMRVVLTRGSMSLGKSDGGLPPDEVVQSARVILADSERLIDKWHDAGRNAMIQIALAPCSPFSVSTDLMKESAVLAREKQVLLHTHLAETLDEDAFCLDMFGMKPVDYLEHVGWLANDVWLAHGIHFTQQEINRLGKAGTAISHCPSSNMLLASGICAARELREAGCPVGLGVDGSASNDASNMIQEVRQAFLIQRLKYGSANVTHEDVLDMATREGAKLFGRDDIGEIAVGKSADLALFNLNELRFAGTGDPLAALVLSGAHRAQHVMVAGQWKVRNGRLIDVDEPALIEEQRAEAKKLTGF